MKQIFTTILFIISICVFKSNYLIAQVNEQDSLALIDFYNSTDGLHWNNHTNWLTTAPVSTWYGITVQDNRVTQISFTANGLNGNIPSSVSNLTALTSLYIVSDNLTGNIPASLGNLEQLLVLYMESDNLTGNIPASLGNLKQLQILDLKFNKLTGNIPGELGNAISLREIDLAHNNLSGSIPYSLGNLNLHELQLNNTNLSGTIPSSLAKLDIAAGIYLNNDHFTFAGMEPMAKFPFIKYSPQSRISLNENNNTLSVYAGGANALADNTYKWYKGSTLVATITGDSTFTPTQNGNYSVAVTNSVATALTLHSDTVYIKTSINKTDSLALVDFYNSTKGPKWVYNANWLTAAPVSTWVGITVEGNRVTEMNFSNIGLNGPIPASFGNLTALKIFSANYGVKGALPSSIGNLTSLQSLSIVFCNDFDGHLPSSIGNLKNLEYLYLFSDNISGTIPSSIGNLSKLKWLNLAGSLLKGNIPASLNNLTNLDMLDLSFNRLSGTIPDLSNLEKLSTLSLQSNQLSGTIPLYLDSLANLGSLSLGQNQLSGNIPPELGRLNLFALDLSYNLLTGEIPEELSNYSNLTSLNLSNNNLTGKIPKWLSNCTNLFELYLSNNKFTGSIPAGLNNLTKLQWLDLSTNQLSGAIPTLSNLTVLYRLYLNTNKFTFAGMEKLGSKLLFADYAPQANISLNKNGSTLSFSAGGQLHHNTYKWYNGSSLVATITGDSTYQPTQGGNYFVAVTNSVATALTLYSDTINYSSGDNLIVGQFNNKNLSVSVYPNPAITNTTLSFNVDGKYTITVADVSGKTLQTKTGVAIKGSTTIQLDVSKYASSMYLITITDDKNRKQTLRLNKE